MRLAAALVVLLASAPGCAPSAEDLCRDTADELGVRSTRCQPEVSLQVARDAAEDALTLSRSCEAVRAIRDREGLVDVCWPAIRALACTVEGPLPPECDDQLIFE